MQQQGAGVRIVVEDHLRRAGVRPERLNVVMEMGLMESAKQAAIAGGQSPQVLSPFSWSSQDVPEAGDHAELGQLKQAAFTTPAGRISNFVPTADGGFVLYVQQMLPIDLAKKTAELPQFTSQVRRARQNEAFNLWLQGEANRELRNTPVYAEAAAKAPAR